MQKKTPNRTKEASCFVRMSEDDRQLIEDAIDRLEADAPMRGMRMGPGAFMLSAAVEKAKEILGKK